MESPFFMCINSWTVRALGYFGIVCLVSSERTWVFFLPPNVHDFLTFLGMARLGCCHCALVAALHTLLHPVVGTWNMFFSQLHLKFVLPLFWGVPSILRRLDFWSLLLCTRSLSRLAGHFCCDRGTLKLLLRLSPEVASCCTSVITVWQFVCRSGVLKPLLQHSNTHRDRSWNMRILFVAQEQNLSPFLTFSGHLNQCVGTGASKLTSSKRLRKMTVQIGFYSWIWAQQL